MAKSHLLCLWAQAHQRVSTLNSRNQAHNQRRRVVTKPRIGCPSESITRIMAVGCQSYPLLSASPLNPCADESSPATQPAAVMNPLLSAARQLQSVLKWQNLLEG